MLELTDQQLACLYLALSEMLRTGAAHAWMHDETKSRPSYPHRDGQAVRFSVSADPKTNAFYCTGHAVHEEAARRGRARLARFLPLKFDWPFESWATFCEALAEQTAQSARL